MYNCVIAVTVGDLVCESEETAAVDDASTETVTTDQPCDEQHWQTTLLAAHR